MAKEKKNYPLFDIGDLEEFVNDGAPNFDGIVVDTPKGVPGGAPMFDGLDECAPETPGPNSDLIGDVESNPQVREIDLREVQRQLEEKKVIVGGVPDAKGNINFDLLSPAEEAAMDFDKFWQTQLKYFARDYRNGDFDNPDITDSLKFYISRRLIELEQEYDVNMSEIMKEWKTLVENKKYVNVKMPKGWPLPPPRTRTPDVYRAIMDEIIKDEEFQDNWRSLDKEGRKQYARELQLYAKDRMYKLRTGLIDINREIIRYKEEVNLRPIFREWRSDKEFLRAFKSWKNQAKVYKKKQWNKGRNVLPVYKKCSDGKGGWIFIPIVFGLHLMGSQDIGQAMELTTEDLINDLMDPLNIESVTGDLDPGSEINWDHIGDDEYFFKVDSLIRGFSEGDIEYDVFESTMIDLQTDAIENEIRSQLDPNFSSSSTLKTRVTDFVQSKMSDNGLSSEEAQTDLKNFAFRQNMSQGSTWDAVNTNAGISSCSSFDYTGFLNPPIDSEKVVINCGGEEPTPTPTPTQLVVTPTPSVTPTETPVTPPLPTPTPSQTSGGSTPTPSLP